MANEEEVVNTEQETAESTAAADTTTVADTQTAPPETSDSPPTGSETTETAETATAAAESEQDKQSKAKPHRAPGAERRISELTAKTKALQAQLRDALAGQGQQATQTAQPKPEETEEFWTQKFQSAQTEAERQQAQQRYTEVHEEKLVARAEQRVLARMEKQQVATRLSEKLARLHERQPFLKEGGKIDVNSPVVLRAAELAAESGVSIAGPQGINYQAFLYFATEAALDMQGQAVQTTEAKLANQKLQTAKATARTNLETSTASAPSKPSGPKADLEKELNRLVAERDKEGAMAPSNPERSKRILWLRQNLRQVASTKT